MQASVRSVRIAVSRVGRAIALLAVIVSLIATGLQGDFGLRMSWRFAAAFAVSVAVAIVLGIRKERREERKRREQEELIKSVTGRSPYALPPLAERDRVFPEVAERPVEVVRWRPSWRELLLVPLLGAVVLGVVIGSGWSALLGAIGLVSLVAYFFMRAVEKKQTDEGVNPWGRLT